MAAHHIFIPLGPYTPPGICVITGRTGAIETREVVLRPSESRAALIPIAATLWILTGFVVAPAGGRPSVETILAIGGLVALSILLAAVGLGVSVLIASKGPRFVAITPTHVQVSIPSAAAAAAYGRLA